MGSSPRMRGSLVATLLAAILLGIIPAHAGLTSRMQTGIVMFRDHPRACGAHASCSPASFQYTGSSPRMRGSLPVKTNGELRTGIIPAHAGLTVAWHTSEEVARDHPRACGAHSSSRKHENLSKGSSPRMRGSRRCIHPGQAQEGIIPAHAGLTALSYMLARCTGDHPRACGAHDWDGIIMSHSQGSSPRMRGSPLHHRCAVPARGIIPAHAGLTPSSSPRQCSSWDHPRACGAHCIVKHFAMLVWGSSPRMRGSHDPTMPPAGEAGIIPAHAGLTRECC